VSWIWDVSRTGAGMTEEKFTLERVVVAGMGRGA